VKLPEHVTVEEARRVPSLQKGMEYPAAPTVHAYHPHPLALMRMANDRNAFLQGEEDLESGARAFPEIAPPQYLEWHRQGEWDLSRHDRNLPSAHQALLDHLNKTLGLAGKE
jgi:hypothetical protein